MERPPARVALAVVIEKASTVTREKILLASDGGVASAAAMRWVIDHVGGRPAEVDIEVEIVDTTAATAENGERHRSVQSMAELLRVVAPDVRVSVSASASDEALHVLERQPDVLLVVGVHRRDHNGSRWAERAVERSSGPVVVVPSEWISRQGPIMVGVGAEDAPSPALAFAEREAASRHTEVKLIHAWDTTGPGEVPPAWDFGTESIPERQRGALARLVRREKDSHPGLNLTAEAVQGQVVAKLGAAARSASLLVVGRSHRAAVTRALFGSSAAGLLEKLPCPVAVVP